MVDCSLLLRWERVLETAARVSRRAEIWGATACVALGLALRLWGLPGQPLNRLFDEGVHLALMQEMAAGRGALYRDLLFIHPPGLIWVGAWLWPRVGGDLFLLRLLYVGFTMLALAPVYALARRLYGAGVAIGALFLLCTSPGLTNWLGRTLFLEPLVNVPLCVALWILVARPRSAPFAALAGLLIGAAFLIKETALPIGCALAAALYLTRRVSDAKCRDSLAPNTLLPFLVGFVPTVALVLLSLARIPNYLLYTFALNASDPFQWELRSHEASTGLFALPIPLTFGLVGVWRMVRRPERPEERLLGVFALLIMLVMVAVPKRFYWRYLLPAVPILCVAAAAWWARFLAHPPAPKLRRITACVAVPLGLVHLLGPPLYHRFDAPAPPAHNTALALLRQDRTPLFTLNPIWAVAAHRPLPRWRFACDAVFARQYGLASPDEFTAVLRQCPTAVFDWDSMRLLPPETEAVLRREYRTVFVHGQRDDRDFVEVLTRRSIPQTP